MNIVGIKKRKKLNLERIIISKNIEEFIDNCSGAIYQNIQLRSIYCCEQCEIDIDFVYKERLKIRDNEQKREKEKWLRPLN